MIKKIKNKMPVSGPPGGAVDMKTTLISGPLSFILLSLTFSPRNRICSFECASEASIRMIMGLALELGCLG